jgi:hypothetical protein
LYTRVYKRPAGNPQKRLHRHLNDVRR